MSQKIKTILFQALPVIILVTLLTVSIIYAWTEPSQAPPGGNVSAPVNIGSATQYKSGALGINGLFRAYSDAIFDGKVGIGTTGPNYKLDVNGNMAATIMYDKDNAGYYVDPNGTTRINAVTPNIIPLTTGDSPNGGYNHYAIYEQPGAWTYPYPDLMIEYHTGISYIAYYGYGGHRFYTGYSPDASPTTLAFSVGEFDNNTRVYNNLYVSGTAYANGQALCQANGTNCLAGSTNADTVDYLHASSFRQFNTWQNNHYSGTDGAEYATIYYDANNSGYYVDPSGSSRMNQLYYVDSAYIVDLRPQYMYDWNDSAYYIDMNNTSRLNYLGRNYGWNWTEYDWNDTSYYMDLNSTSRLNRLDFRYGYDMDDTGYYIDLNNTTRANEIQTNRVYGFTDIRSPIFYDYNNTGYYVDPNGTSRMNTLYYVDQAYIVDIRPQYMYDWNDSAYYIDMNNTSRLNYLGRNYGWNWTEYDWNDTNYYMDLNNVSILNDLRVNILYDRQNTGYYVDPASVSNFNAANFAGNIGIGYEIVSNSVYAAGHYDVSVSCSSGKVVIGGGCVQSGNVGNTAIVSNGPSGTTSWYCRTRDVQYSTARTTTVYAICARVGG